MQQPLHSEFAAAMADAPPLRGLGAVRAIPAPPAPAAAGQPLILFFPDYRPTNPYQHNLYAAFPEPARIRPGTIDEAARLAAAGEDVLFHLHWPEALFAGCDTPDRIAHRAANILAWIAELHRHGGRCVWTAHNAIPHERREDAPLRQFHRDLLAAVDAVHVHSAAALDMLDMLYPSRRTPALVVPHGTAPRPAPPRSARILARMRLGLRPDTIVIACIGQLRLYKGIDRLIAAFRAIRRHRDDIELLIAGKPEPASLAGRWTAMAEGVPGVVVREGFMAEEALDAGLAAADAMVIPYETILTSGSASLAIERGLPLILPDLPTLGEYHAAAAIGFDPGDLSALVDAITGFADLAPAARALLSGHGLRLAGTRTWGRVGADLGAGLAAIPRPVATPSAAPPPPPPPRAALPDLYARAHATGAADAAADAEDGWRGLLPPDHAAEPASLRILIERATRSGWRDGRAGVTPGDGGGIDAPMADDTAMCGNLDLVAMGRIAGWACRAAPPVGDGTGWTGAGSVWLVADGVPVVELDAATPRGDLGAAGLAVGAGFAILVDQAVAPLIHGAIELRCGRTGQLICTAATPAAADATPPPIDSPPAVGATLHGIAGGVLAGRARDAGRPERPVLVDVEVDGVRHRDVPADRAAAARDPLAATDRDTFELVLPAATCRKAAVAVRIFENRTETMLCEAVLPNPPAGGYDPAWQADAYLRWAYLHGPVPIGHYAASADLRGWFALNRRLLAPAAGAALPAVDIVMPVHNRRGIVGTAIASVLAQTHDGWRLFVVDDGSDDGTADEVRAVIAALADPRLILLPLGARGGVSAARNAGLAAGAAGLVAYLDSDNAWEPDYLAVMAAAMAAHPAAATAYCGQEIWQRPAGAAVAEPRTILAAPFNRSLLERGNMIDLNVFMHRRSLYEAQGGFRTDLRRLVDWDLILRYTRDAPAHFVPAILGRYNVDAAANRITTVEPLADAMMLVRTEHAIPVEEAGR